MQIVPDKKSVLLRVKNPKRITEAIPKSREFPGNVVAVKLDLDEMRVLRNLGVSKAPSPIRYHYDWGKTEYKPMDHQTDTAELMTLHPRCFVLNEPGTGKTHASIWALDYLMRKAKVKKLLIISPISIIDSAWTPELMQVCPQEYVTRLTGTKEQRLAQLKVGAKISIINTDGIKTILTELLAADFDAILVDEAGKYRNVDSDRWRALNRLGSKATHLFLMTGTPTPKAPTDAYGLAKLLNPKSVPSYYSRFRDQTMTQIAPNRWVAKPEGWEIARSVLRPAVAFLKKDCLQLPPVTYIDRKVDMSKEQKKAFDDLVKDSIAKINGMEVTAKNPAILLAKLLQVAAGVVRDGEGEGVVVDVTPRLNALEETIEEYGGHVLIFAQHKLVIAMLAKKIEEWGYSVGVCTGETPVSARSEMIRAFEKGDLDIILAHPLTLAHGVTLVSASTVIWYSPTHSSEDYSQGNSRVDRKGQTQNVTVIRMFSTTVEHQIYKKVTTQISAQDLLLAAVGLV